MRHTPIQTVDAERNNAIRSAYENGTATQAELARQYGVTRARIGQIITRREFKLRQARERALKYVVYVLKCEAYVKIGIALDLQKRLKAIRAGCPLPITCLGTILGGRELEAELHKRFQQWHAHHEWFYATPELLAALENLLALQPLHTVSRSGQVDKSSELTS